MRFAGYKMAIYALLPTGVVYCVDFDGQKKELSAMPYLPDTKEVCP
jgi:hypothetical protein